MKEENKITLAKISGQMETYQISNIEDCGERIDIWQKGIDKIIDSEKEVPNANPRKK